MGRIQRQHQAIRALIVARKVELVQLALTRAEAIARFEVTRRELAQALTAGQLGYGRGRDADALPVWRLERLYARR